LITPQHLSFALCIVPAIGLGLILSQPLEARFSRQMVKPAALIFSSIAAIILLLKALIG